MTSRQTRLERELARVAKALGNLGKAFLQLGPALAANGAQESTATSTGRKKPRLTAAYRATLKLQGQYMGTLRGLPARKRAAVKRLRAEKGISAAIAAARRMAS